MSDGGLIDALREWWSGGAAPDAIPFGASLSEIERHAGSGRKAAKAAGIPETTWRRLKRGVMPKTQAKYRAKLKATLRAVSLKPTVQQQWKRDRLTVKAIVPSKGGKGGTEQRTITLKMRPGAVKKALDAYVAGDDRAAVAAFRGGIKDQWYRDVMFGEWMDDGLAYEGEDQDGDYHAAVVSIR